MTETINISKPITIMESIIDQAIGIQISVMDHKDKMKRVNEPLPEFINTWALQFNGVTRISCGMVIKRYRMN